MPKLNLRAKGQAEKRHRASEKKGARASSPRQGAVKVEVPTCKFDGHFINPCSTLNDIIEEASDKRKGAQFRVLRDRKTFKRTRDLVVFNLGKFRPGGIVANFCPFCGTKICNPEED